MALCNLRVACQKRWRWRLTHTVDPNRPKRWDADPNYTFEHPHIRSAFYHRPLLTMTSVHSLLSVLWSVHFAILAATYATNSVLLVHYFSIQKKQQTCLTAVPPDQPWCAGTKSVETTLHPLSPLLSWLPWNGLHNHNIKGRGLRAEPWGLLSWSWHSLSWFHRWWHPAGSFLKVCKEMFGDCRGGNFPINSHKALEANKPRWLNNFTPMAGQISGEIFVSCTGWHIKSRPLHFNAYNMYTTHTHWKFL